MADANIRAVITADDRASKVLSGVGKSMQTIGRIAKVGLAASSVAVTAFGVASVKAFTESEDASAQLQAVLKSTGQVAGVTSKQALGLASSLQRVTKFSDEAILGGENLLLTFTKIGKDIFPEATETMLDMSQALGQDVKASAIQLGKALQDPILGVTALRRVGVNFSNAQRDVIKNLVETGKSAEAQRLILKELKVEFGGSAKAAGKTFAGQLEIAKNMLDDFMEVAGEGIVKVLRPMLTIFQNWFKRMGGAEGVMKALKDAITPVIKSIKDIAKQVGDYLQPKIEALINTVRDLIEPVKQLAQTHLKTLAGVVGGALVVALGLAVDALNALLTIVQPLINYLAEHENAVYALVAAYVALKTALTIHSAFLALQAAVVAVRMGFIAQTVATVGFTGALGALRVAMLAVIATPLGLVLGAISLAVGALTFQFLKNKTETDNLKAAQERLKGSTDALKESQDRLKGAKLGVEQATLNLKRATERETEAIRIYGRKSDEAKQATIDRKRAVLDLKEAHRQAKDAVQKHKEMEQGYAKDRSLIQSANDKASAVGNLIGQLQQQSQYAIFKDYGKPLLNPKPSAPTGIHNALGTDFWRGGTTMVGERGAEMVTLPRGSKITPNDKLGGSINMNVNVGVYAGTPMEKRKLATEIFKAFQDVALQAGISPSQLLDGSNGASIR